MLDQILNIFQSIDWASPTWDVFILLFFVIAAFIYGMSMGRDRILVIVVSIYMALAIVQYAPFLQQEYFVTLGNGYVVQVTSFLSLFIVLFFVFSRSALLKTLAGSNSGKWWQVLLFSFLHVGLLISVALSFLPQEALNHLSPMTRDIFAQEYARFGWVIAPVLLMSVVKGDDD